MNWAFPNEEEFGLTKREYTAVQILQGLFSATPGIFNTSPGEKIKMIKKAIEYTDCLLNELNNTSKKEGLNV